MRCLRLLPFVGLPAVALLLLGAPPGGAYAPAPFVPRIQKEITNSIGLKLVRIPPGKFLMGARDDERQAGSDEKPRHEVEITRAFYLGMYEVTQEEYQKVMGQNPSRYQGKRFPVESVTWNDCVAFCARLSALPEEKKAGRAYRLPTEAEWEYACRGGAKDSKIYWWGDEPKTSEANFNRALGRPTTVGSYKPNGFGLFDMHGNVYEWCQDWHNGNYYRTGPKKDPPGPPQGTSRIYRGGNFSSVPNYVRSAYRNSSGPTSSYYGVGMRVACDLGRGK